MTRSRTICSSAVSASKSTMVAKREPARSAAVSGRIEPRWNIGSGSHQTSASVSPNRSLIAWPVRTIASCVSGHPFGCAVVPDVYIMIATSRMRTVSAAASISVAATVPASSSKRARSTNPSGDESPSSTEDRSAGASAAASCTSPTKSTSSPSTSLVTTTESAASRST